MTPEERELDMLIAELDQENRLLRARNEHLEKELACVTEQIKRLTVKTDSGCQCFACQVTPHSSDCAVHNAPAYPYGPCDCGVYTPKAVQP